MNTPHPVQVRGVHFAYDREPVLTDFALAVGAGELFALLGASGSGKSTVLSLLAGLLIPDRGTIQLGEDDVTRAPPQHRRVGVVFQSYALFPHLSARANIGFAPRQRGIPRAEVEPLVDELAARLGITGLLERRPEQLSGGQQQRVALARALAMRPRLLLLDEPMSNVDPALRTQLRGELRAWLTRWRVTTILVTHDREDAFWLADELGLLRDGRLLQRGRPSHVYAEPVDLDAARLLGPADAVPVRPRGDGTVDWISPTPTHTAILRPEQLRFVPGPVVGEGVATRVESVVDLGHDARVSCRVGAVRVWARGESVLKPGTKGHLLLPPDPWMVPGVEPA